MTNDKTFISCEPCGDEVIINGARFRMDGVMWQGSDSRIFSAHPLESGADSAFVIKRFRCRENDARWDACLREIEAWLMLRRCRHILPLLGYAVRTNGGEEREIFLLFDRKECLSGLSLTPPEVAGMCCDITRALKDIRRKKLVHGDVKPANIYRSGTGWLLGDMGSVTRSGEAARYVSEGYCSPEALRGEPCDYRSDIYSLGITCYRLLSGGRLPFCDRPCGEMTEEEMDRAIERRLSGEEIPPIPGVPDRLNEAVLAMCAFEPKKRKNFHCRRMSDKP